MKGTELAPNKAGSFTGITYSADGKRLFFSQDDNHLVIANVNPSTGVLTNGQSVELPPPPADGRLYYKPRAINPGGIAVSADGKHAYVALNAANTLGVIDLSDMTVETPETVAGRIRAALPHVPPERLVVAPDCGMKYLPRAVAYGKMKAMVDGARIVRQEVRR